VAKAGDDFILTPAKATAGGKALEIWEAELVASVRPEHAVALVAAQRAL
jgi:hypothetical protein